MNRYFRIQFRIRTLMVLVFCVCICLVIGIRRSHSIAQYNSISFDLLVWRATHASIRGFQSTWDREFFTEIGDMDSNSFGFRIDPWGDPSIELTVFQPIFPYINMPELRIVKLGNPNVALSLEEFNSITEQYVRVNPLEISTKRMITGR